MPTSAGYMTVAGREFLLSVVEVMTCIADIALVNGLNESRTPMALSRRPGRRKNWEAQFQ